MIKKGALFSIAGIFVLSFLVGFRNADKPPLSETLAAIPKEETVITEVSASDGLRTQCVDDIGFCFVDDTGFCIDPKPSGLSAGGGLPTMCVADIGYYSDLKPIGWSTSDEPRTNCVADPGFCLVDDAGFCIDPKPSGSSASD
jgi:hypothetical protein